MDEATVNEYPTWVIFVGTAGGSQACTESSRGLPSYLQHEHLSRTVHTTTKDEPLILPGTGAAPAECQSARHNCSSRA
jgi:hypothetical protein